MIPVSKTDCDFETKGEERVFDLLKRLPDHCLVYYEILLGERDHLPDFTVVDPDRGVVVIEVKDWGKETILSASKKTFEIRSHGGHHQPRHNHEWQCQRYLREAREQLGTAPELLGEHERLIVPTTHLVVMPNLTEEFFKEEGFEKKGVLFRDHLALKDEVSNAAAFLEKVRSMLPILPKPLSVKQVLAIRAKLRNDVIIDVPKQVETEVVTDAERIPDDVFAIDVEQETLAKGLGEGPRLMRGIAGTGKTLIMLMKAKIMASNAEAREMRLKILIVCWNISLANYMRQVFGSLHGIPLKDSSAVKITHFMQFARELVKAHNRNFPQNPQKDPLFEEKVTKLLAKLRVSEEERYAAIFVDEGQDFQEQWISFLYHEMLRGYDPTRKTFVVAADDAQRIYHSRDFSWAKLNIEMRGRSRILRRVYRNSARVWGFAAFLFGGSLEAFYPGGLKRLEFAPKPGHDPLLIEKPSLQEQINTVVSVIQDRPGQYLLRNILILYRRAEVNGYSLVDNLIVQLEKHGIRYQWITQDNDSKATFIWADDCVKISTVHSAKGMDAPFVIVLGAETFDSTDTDETRLMYVALTRAREYLMVLYSGNGGMVSKLRGCQALYQKKNVKSILISLEQKAIADPLAHHEDALDQT